MRLAVCWKWLASDADGTGGVSAADEAALEIALTVSGVQPDTDVRVVSCGGADAEQGLRRALAAGADHAVHLGGHPNAASLPVAAALASVVDDCDVVLCGDHSLDRGSGSVPAFLAGLLRRPQALGLLAVDVFGGDTWRATRRLDGGRREMLAVVPPAVVSVEAPAARLRRASLPATRAAATASIELRPGPSAPAEEAAARMTRYAPRTRVVAAPAATSALERINALTDVGDLTPRSEAVTVEPEAAAELIVSRLREWGYFPSDPR
jgi:electron transfer flavoprotein beta subunit